MFVRFAGVTGERPVSRGGVMVCQFSLANCFSGCIRAGFAAIFILEVLATALTVPLNPNQAALGPQDGAGRFQPQQGLLVSIEYIDVFDTFTRFGMVFRGATASDSARQVVLSDKSDQSLRFGLAKCTEHSECRSEWGSYG